MTNGKNQTLSKDQKDEIKGIVQGAYSDIVLIPQTTKREQNFDEIVKVLSDGKYFVMRAGYSRNSVYTLIRKLKDTAKLDVAFGITESEVNGKKVRQFALYKKKEKKA